MTARDERTLLLLRLRAATGECSRAPAPPEAECDGLSPEGEEDRLARFGEAFTAAGGLVLPGPPEAVLHDLGEALRVEGVTVLFAAEGDAEAYRVAEALAPFGPFTLASCADIRTGKDAAVTAGFRTAEAGIAETGTVIETSAEGKRHLPGLLSDVHVSLLPAGSILGRLEDAPALHGAGLPRHVFFRSGADRTGDIEQTFVPGVFGPRKAIVLLLP